MTVLREDCSIDAHPVWSLSATPVQMSKKKEKVNTT